MSGIILMMGMLATCSIQANAGTVPTIRPTPRVFHVPRLSLRLEKVGSATIEAGNNYSENTVLRATVVYPPGHPNEGATVTGFSGTVRFTEDAPTSYYNGTSGATALPRTITAVSGVAQITIKSVSNANVVAGPASAIIRATASSPNVDVNTLAVDQWVDEDSNGIIDWLLASAGDKLAHFRTVAGITGQVAGQVTGIDQVGAAVCGSTPIDQGRIGISPVCEVAGVNRHRLNISLELSDTVIHEARHVWQHAQENAALGTGAVPTNDSDDDHCPEAVPAGSQAAAIVDGVAPSTGDNSPDLPYPSFCQPMFEGDAQTFAAAHHGD